MGLHTAIQRSSNQMNKNKTLNYAIIESSTNIDYTMNNFLTSEDIIVDSRLNIFGVKTSRSNPDPSTDEHTFE